MTVKTCDAIVIGASHDGLTRAAFLAEVTLRVLVLEKNGYMGGATVTRELHEGRVYANCSWVRSLFRHEISSSQQHQVRGRFDGTDNSVSQFEDLRGAHCIAVSLMYQIAGWHLRTRSIKFRTSFSYVDAM